MSITTVLPWIVPPAGDKIRNWICSRGERLTFKQRDVLLQETHPYDSLFFIVHGAVGQGVVNPALYTKPLAMNIYTEGRLMGFLNIFTGMPSPRKLIALLPTEVYRYPHSLAREEIIRDPELFFEISCYCELSAKSELLGMELLSTLGPEHRLCMLFAVLLLSEYCIDLKGNILCNTEDAPAAGMAPLPYALTRDSMRHVVYLSHITFDRLLGTWIKNGWYVRDDTSGKVWVEVSRLKEILDWIAVR